MSLKGPPLNEQLCNLTHFCERPFNAWDVIFLKLPVFPVVSFFPGDFRTVGEIKQTAEENQKLGSYYLDLPVA
jgi:hypothetical protein